jgi:ATP-dependent Lon protease
MSLGGVRDEAEIRGHRRTYIGALPGRIIQGLRRAETRDPVFMLDEIDKIGADWRGDPSSALLEVLDPPRTTPSSTTTSGSPSTSQQVLFIATANSLETIPGPLRDRMEILMLSGYTDAEKIGIATQYLIPKQLAAHGLAANELSFEPEAIRQMIRGYTREAGREEPRSAEIAAVARKVARRLAEGERASVRITADNSGRLPRPSPRSSTMWPSGPPVRVSPRAWPGRRPAVTCLFVEVTMMPSSGGAARPHRDARRRHARERAGRPCPTCGPTPRRWTSTQALRGQDHPRPRAGRGHSQGRTLGRG